MTIAAPFIVTVSEAVSADTTAIIRPTPAELDILGGEGCCAGQWRSIDRHGLRAADQAERYSADRTGRKDKFLHEGTSLGNNGDGEER